MFSNNLPPLLQALDRLGLSMMGSYGFQAQSPHRAAPCRWPPAQQKPANYLVASKYFWSLQNMCSA